MTGRGFEASSNTDSSGMGGGASSGSDHPSPSRVARKLNLPRAFWRAQAWSRGAHPGTRDPPERPSRAHRGWANHTGLTPAMA
jgi:hypothetical protein